MKPLQVPVLFAAWILSFPLVALLAVAASGEDSWERGPELATVLVEKPHLSRGLTLA